MVQKISALPLNRHQRLDQVVKNLLAELPEDHNDDVGVVIYLDGMWGMKLSDPLVIDGKSYVVEFRPTSEYFPAGWVGLTYSQGVYEKATNSALGGMGCLGLE